MDAQALRCIDTLYRNGKLMRLFCLLGLIIPLLLLIGSILGLMYWSWRRDLLKDLDDPDAADQDKSSTATGQPGEISLQEKIDYLRDAKYTFLTPSVVLVVYCLVAAAVIAFFTQNPSSWPAG